MSRRQKNSFLRPPPVRLVVWGQRLPSLGLCILGIGALGLLWAVGVLGAGGCRKVRSPQEREGPRKQAPRYELGQVGEMDWDAPSGDANSLAVLTSLGPRELARAVLDERGGTVASLARANRMMLALKRAGKPPARVEGLLVIYRRHPESEIVDVARDELLRLQKHRPWRVALSALRRSDEPALLGFLGGLTQAAATWKKRTVGKLKLPPPKKRPREGADGEKELDAGVGAKERGDAGPGRVDGGRGKVGDGASPKAVGSPRVAVLSRILARVLERETVFYAQPEMKLNVAILARHAPAAVIRKLFPRLRSKLQWNRLAVALAEEGRVLLAREFSVPPNLLRIYATAKALYDFQKLLDDRKDHPEWAERRIAAAFVRVSHLLAGFSTHGCIPEPKRRLRELSKVRNLLRKRLAELIKALKKSVRKSGGTETEDVKQLFENLRFMTALGDAVKLSVALEQTRPCEVNERRRRPPRGGAD